METTTTNTKPVKIAPMLLKIVLRIPTASFDKSSAAPKFEIEQNRQVSNLVRDVIKIFAWGDFCELFE